MRLTALLVATNLIACVNGDLGDSPAELEVRADSGVTHPSPCTDPVVDSGAPSVVADSAPPAVDTAPPPPPPEDTAPPPPTKLPLPDMSKTVAAVGAAHPDWVARSCQNSGGTWELMDAIVDELRKTDTRWGYNWKRGVIGDPSHDAIDYHWGTGPSEGSKDVYIIDVVIGHCGSSPAAGWIDVTEATAMGGTIGIWTGRARF